MSNAPLDELRADIRARVRARMRAGHWPGVALGIELDGAVHLETLGLANLEHRVRVRKETVFRIGSVTKQFTAALILKLQEMGKLSVGDDITRYLPDYPTGGRLVTVHHLLTHTSGIQSYTALPVFWARSREDLSPEALLALFKDEPFRFEPGEQYEYSNSGYHLLGMIIEGVLGRPYRDCLAEHLFAPLGLDHTQYLNNSPVVANRASGYVWENGQWRNAPYLSMRLPFAAGSIGSTVEDLLTWQGALNRGSVLSGNSLQSMRTRKPLNSGEPSSYGYGVAVAEFEGTPKLTHAGGINGFAGILSFYPAYSLTIAVLVNLGSANPFALESEIARLVLRKPGPRTEVIELPIEQLERYAGSYSLRGQTLLVARDAGGLLAFGQRYVPTGSDSFVAEDDPESKVVFAVGANGAESARAVREGIETLYPRVE